VLLGMIGSLLTGTKTSFYMFTIAGVIYYLVLTNKVNGWKRNINFKMLIKLSAGMFVALVLFVVIDSAQGRILENMTLLDKLATYIASPIKNLELFISENTVTHEILGAQTLRSTYSEVYKMTGYSLFDVKSLYTYRWISGNGLGNVYTIFMPLYNDFGTFGTFCVMGAIGLFSQRIYDRIKYDKYSYNIDIRTIFYGYLSFAVIFSFFSNKFFECIVSKAGLYFLVGLFVFDLLFKRIKGNKLLMSKNIHLLR
jgi:oligosaccharide repeat unit polymerase